MEGLGAKCDISAAAILFEPEQENSWPGVENRIPCSCGEYVVPLHKPPNNFESTSTP